MYRTASYPKALEAEPSALSSRSFALGAALLLVSLSYLLLLAAPAVSRHFRGLAAGHAGGAALESWLPLVSVSGLALGGGAALLFVLMQIAREAARRPYVALAPVLAAFAGCILIGLRAQLPMAGVASEQVAVFALAVSVVGGALVQETGFLARATGLLFTLLPSVSLLLVVWTVSGKSDFWLALWSLPSATRAYLTMLAVSSSAIALLAVLGRRCIADEPAPNAALRSSDWSLAAQADAVMAEAHAREQSYADDEAALARRGLPTWLVACLSACAVVGGFFALKLVLDGRSTRAPLALVSAAETKPLQVDPAPAVDLAPQPTVTALAPIVPAAQPVQAVPVQAVQPALRDAEPVQQLPVVAFAQPVAESSTGHAPRRHSRRPHKSLTAPPVETKQVAVRSAKSAAIPDASAKTEALSDQPSQRERASEDGKRAGLEAKRASEEGSARKASKREASEPTDEARSAVQASAPAAKSAPEKSLASRLLAKPTEKAPADKPVPTRGDESLDELMDNVVKSKRGAKAGVGAGDDPIFGL